MQTKKKENMFLSERMNELLITKWLHKEDLFFTQNTILHSG